jgi:hypothetical protein
LGEQPGKLRFDDDKSIGKALKAILEAAGQSKNYSRRKAKRAQISMRLNASLFDPETIMLFFTLGDS